MECWLLSLRKTETFTHSSVFHMSAIVPPTRVAPVDPAAPWKNLKMITVPMFCALQTGGGQRRSRKDDTGKSAYSAIGREHRANIVLVMIYNGRRPNSSEKLAVNRGVTARPVVYEVRHRYNRR
jgi:hypothetical protein